MSLLDYAERHSFLPWIVLGGVVWLAATTASLYLLPKSFLQPALVTASPIIAWLVIVCIPRSNLKRELMWFTKNWLACSLLFGFFVVGVVVILLLGCSAVGYLPYSDRPGPGWGNIPAHFPRWEEVGLFAGWAAVFLMPICVFSGSILFFLVAWSGWFGAPKWLIRVSGAALCGLLTLLATDGAGWVIAIAAFPVYATGVSGLLFGALVLPRFLSQPGSSTPKWRGIMLVSLAHLAVAAWVMFPFWGRYF